MSYQIRIDLELEMWLRERQRSRETLGATLRRIMESFEDVPKKVVRLTMREYRQKEREKKS